MGALTHYEQLARLFDYPERDYPAHVMQACELLGTHYPSAKAELASFADALPAEGEVLSREALDTVQEIFTRSFDVQSITTLGVGYVVFGDDYKRGELLVNLSREYDEAGIECGTELPDHLPNVLRLISKWRDRGLVSEFVEEILYPALARMLEEFEPQRTSQRDGLYKKHYKTLIEYSAMHGTIFRKPLAAVLEVLKQDFKLTAWKPPEQDNDFLRTIGRELDIEATEGRPARSGRIL
ncbi:MAG: hypothetical protein ACE5HT_04140 [Gemmatimonadales bacterium]